MKKNIFSGILLGVFCLVWVCAVALAILHATDFLYRFDIHFLDIPSQTGLSEEVLLQNYHAILQDLNPFCSAAVTLPDFPFSEQGAFHFQECKTLFTGVYVLGIICLGLSVLLLFFLKRKNKIHPAVFFSAAVTTVFLPLLLLSAIAINAEKSFTLFHQIFFRNNYWIFDINTDPVIQILPMDFFLHCGIFIGLCWILCAAILFVLGMKRKKQNRTSPFWQKSSKA